MKKALHKAFTQYIAMIISMSITLQKVKFYMLNEKEIEVRNQCTLPAPWSSIHIYFHQNSIKHFVKSDEKGKSYEFTEVYQCQLQLLVQRRSKVDRKEILAISLTSPQ